jgi:lysophospholipase L1-like esterase
MAFTISRPPEKTSGSLDQRTEKFARPLWSKLLRHVVWSVLALIFGIGLLEGIFALAHIGEESFIQLEPRVGVFHMPGKLLTWREEGYEQLVFNSAGFRDKERSLVKPAGTRRVVVLGNSMIEAWQVKFEQTACARLEALLNKRGLERYEVLNGGVSGYNTVQDLYLFKDKLLKYHPDVCVVSYHYGDNEKNIVTDYVKYDLPRPYCALDDKSRLQTDWSAFDGCWKSENAAFFNKTEWLRRHSRIWDVLLQLDLQLATFKPYNQLRAAWGRISSSAPGKYASAAGAPVARRLADTSLELLGTANPDPTYFADLNTVIPSVPFFKELPMASSYTKKKAAEVAAIRYESASWRAIQGASRKRFWVTARILEEFNALCAQNNCKLVVLGLPARNNSMLFFKEMQFIKNLGRVHNFVVVDSHETFPKFGPAEANDYYFDLHFTAKGNDAIAAALYKGFTEQGLVR